MSDLPVFETEQGEEIKRLQARVQQLEQERTALLTGIRFYAEQASYSNGWTTGDPMHVMEDRGSVARNALTQVIPPK